MTGWLQAATADEESRTLRTLAFATTEELIHATLEFALGLNVRSQDAAGVRSFFLGRDHVQLLAAGSRSG